LKDDKTKKKGLHPAAFVVKYLQTKIQTQEQTMHIGAQPFSSFTQLIDKELAGEIPQ